MNNRLLTKHPFIICTGTVLMSWYTFRRIGEDQGLYNMLRHQRTSCMSRWLMHVSRVHRFNASTAASMIAYLRSAVSRMLVRGAFNWTRSMAGQNLVISSTSCRKCCLITSAFINLIPAPSQRLPARPRVASRAESHQSPRSDATAGAVRSNEVQRACTANSSVTQC